MGIKRVAACGAICRFLFSNHHRRGCSISALRIWADRQRKHCDGNHAVRPAYVRRRIILKQSIAHIALVVRDYDEALDFYLKKLDFVLIEDTYQPDRTNDGWWFHPPGSVGTTLLLAKASKPEQEPFIEIRQEGRVFLLLNSDDFWRDTTTWLQRNQICERTQTSRLWNGGGFRRPVWKSLGFITTEWIEP